MYVNTNKTVFDIPDETVIVVHLTLKQYKCLLDDSVMLRHLEANGVDNWEGYSRPSKVEEDDN